VINDELLNNSLYTKLNPHKKALKHKLPNIRIAKIMGFLTVHVCCCWRK